MEKTVDINRLIVKEVLNDFANDFELHLNKVKGLESLTQEEILFLSDIELMASAVVTINNAIDGEINGLEALILLLESANADIREDTLWLKLLLERRIVLKFEQEFLESSFFHYLLILASKVNKDYSVSLIKFIKVIKTFDKEMREFFIGLFCSSNFIKNNYEKIDKDIKNLFNGMGIKNNQLLSNKKTLMIGDKIEK